MIGADGASLSAGRELDGVEFALQAVKGQKPSHQEVSDTCDVLHCFECLKGSDDAAHGADDSGLLAGRNGVLRGHFLEYAAVAGPLVRNDGHELALEADDSRVGERFVCHDAGVVDQEFRGEIIGSVDDKIVVPDNVQDVAAGDEVMIGLDLDVRVDGVSAFSWLISSEIVMPSLTSLVSPDTVIFISFCTP